MTIEKKTNSIDFIKFELVIDNNNVVGSYTLKNENGETIGYSEGYTMRRRSILFKIYQTKNVFEIIQREKGYFLIMQDENIVAAFKSNIFGTEVELRTSKDNVIKFSTKDVTTKMIIKCQKSEIGIVSSEDWYTKNIGIVLNTDAYFEFILCTILGIAYKSRYSFTRLF